MLPPRATLASLTSSSRLESLGAALAFGSDHGPPLPARRRPPARARPPSSAVPSATAPRSRLSSAPLGSGSPRHRAGRRVFHQRCRRSPPPPPLTSGGVGGVERRPGAGREVRPRRGLRPTATRPLPHHWLPAGGLGPLPLPASCRPAPRSLGLRHKRGEVGRGRDSGHCLEGIGLTRSFRSVPQRWAAGLGNGAEELPTLQLLEPTRASPFGASIRGRGAGEIEAPFWGRPEWVFWPEILLRFLAPTPAGPRSQIGTGLTNQLDPLISGESAPCFSCSTQRDSSALVQPAPREDSPPGDSCCTEPAPKK